MTIPKDYPLESFDPRFIEILKRGARGDDFTIQCQNENEAVRLQHMLHSYRARAKKYYGDEHQDMWRPLYIAIITRVRDKDGKKTLLHIRSRHNEFASTLASILPDYEPPSLSTDPLAEFFSDDKAKPEGSGK